MYIICILCNYHISQLGRHTGMGQDPTIWMLGLTSSPHFDLHFQWRHGGSPRPFPVSTETSTTTTTEYPQPLCKGKGKAVKKPEHSEAELVCLKMRETNVINQCMECGTFRQDQLSMTCSAWWPYAGANISGVSGAAACFCLYGGRPAWLADIWCFRPRGCSQRGFMQK